MATEVVQYTLPEGVFLARGHKSYIFMDISNDSYFSLPKRYTEALDRLVCDKPDPLHGEVSDLVRLLATHGLIAEVYGVDSAVIVVGKHLDYIEAPDQTVLGRRPIELEQLYVFGRSYVKARRLLRSGGIGPGVKYLLNRRRFPQESAHDPAELYQLATVFHRIKPMFFSRRGNCLLNSLVLLVFLDHYRIQRTWCFGVKDDPFQAHCWVRVNETLVDDQICSVHRFSLIAEI